MDPKELRGLMEAYAEVYAPQEEIEEAVKGASRHDIEMRKAAASERRSGAKDRLSSSEGERNAAKMKRDIKFYDKITKKTKPSVVGMTHEEVEIFDVVLEFLQAEGYAETLEEAEWLMANVIDEEAIEIILGEGKVELDQERRSRMGRQIGKKVRSADAEYSLSKDTMYPKGLRGAMERGARKKVGQAQKIMGALKSAQKEEYELDEAQAARENPEKYEAGEKKKYAPVRGEKTPMPPRGDKRREDFEKWYAANVR